MHSRLPRGLLRLLPCSPLPLLAASSVGRLRPTTSEVLLQLQVIAGKWALPDEEEAQLQERRVPLALRVWAPWLLLQVQHRSTARAQPPLL